jgi:chromosome segregation ATPase
LADLRDANCTLEEEVSRLNKKYARLVNAHDKKKKELEEVKEGTVIKEGLADFYLELTGIANEMGYSGTEDHDIQELLSVVKHGACDRMAWFNQVGEKDEEIKKLEEIGLKLEDENKILRGRIAFLEASNSGRDEKLFNKSQKIDEQNKLINMLMRYALEN